jgi:hypothetical protein
VSLRWRNHKRPAAPAGVPPPCPCPKADRWSRFDPCSHISDHPSDRQAWERLSSAVQRDVAWGVTKAVVSIFSISRAELEGGKMEEEEEATAAAMTSAER